MSKQIQRTKLIKSGKANDCYATTDPNITEIEATDRVSANDGERMDIIPGKGLANSTISRILFELLDTFGIPNHYIGKGENSQSMMVLKADMLPLEVLCRWEAAGSLCKNYGVASGTEFSEPLIEYTYKNDSAHDPRIDRETIVALGIATKREIGAMDYYTEQTAIILRKIFAELGVRLIDFKLEFGRIVDNVVPTIMICDEISPDTCRLVDMETGKKFDKDPYRQGASVETVAKVYEDILERVTEDSNFFEVDLEDEANADDENEYYAG